MTIYTGGQAYEPGKFPSVLAIGDSWFWYPNNNLLEGLVRSQRLRDDVHIVRLGQNGARLASYIDLPDRPGKFADDLKFYLEPQNITSFTTVMISGAGNDAIDYRLGLNKDCTGFKSASECFNSEGGEELLKQLSQDIGLLLNEILWAFTKTGNKPMIFLHSYDYPIPDGRHFTLANLIKGGPWLKPAMDECKVPNDLELRKEICHQLIDYFSQTLATFHNPSNGVYFIDSRGGLRTDEGYQSDWANELHPSPSGFDRIVMKYWLPALTLYGQGKIVK